MASSLTFDLNFGLGESCGRDLCPVLNNSVQVARTAEVGKDAHEPQVAHSARSLPVFLSMA